MGLPVNGDKAEVNEAINIKSAVKEGVKVRLKNIISQTEIKMVSDSFDWIKKPSSYADTIKARAVLTYEFLFMNSHRMSVKVSLTINDSEYIIQTKDLLGENREKSVYKNSEVNNVISSMVMKLVIVEFDSLIKIISSNMRRISQRTIARE